jgi:hypothetical protein
MSTQPQGVSLLPDDFIQGGLIDDVDARIVTARWVEYDYGGKAEKPALAIHLNILTQDGEHDEYYSCGDLSRLQPNRADGGRTLLPLDGHIIRNTKAAWLLESFIVAGFPKTDIGTDLAAFDNTEVHLLRRADPERVGLKSQRDPSKGQQTTLLVKNILSLPKDPNKLQFVGAGVNASQSVGAPSASTGAPAAVSAPAQAGVDIEAKATEHILNVLGSNGGVIAKAKLSAELIKSVGAAGDVAIQGPILGKAFSNDWMKAADKPWKVDANGNVSL